MHTLELEFRSLAGTELRRVPIRNLVIAGWTGRDAHKLQEHIEELAAIGVAPPAEVPCFYPSGNALPTTAERIDVLGPDSSGEVEWVMLLREEGWFVGLGSDHTDRRVESYSITVSKQMCPKPVAAALWPFAEVERHWDRLELLAEIDEGAGFIPYQRGSVAAMREPRDILARRAFGPDTLVFGGTLPVLGGIRPAAAFRMRLHDPVLGRSITHAYGVRVL